MINFDMSSIKSITGTGINKAIDITAGDEKAADGAPSFAEFLSGAINNVNDLQKASDTQKQDFASGKTDNIQDVMIAMEKADIGFQMALQIRNKVLEAYQEIMRMPI